MLSILGLILNLAVLFHDRVGHDFTMRGHRVGLLLLEVLPSVSRVGFSGTATTAPTCEDESYRDQHRKRPVVESVHVNPQIKPTRSSAIRVAALRTERSCQVCRSANR